MSIEAKSTPLFEAMSDDQSNELYENLRAALRYSTADQLMSLFRCARRIFARQAKGKDEDNDLSRQLLNAVQTFTLDPEERASLVLSDRLAALMVAVLTGKRSPFGTVDVPIHMAAMQTSHRLHRQSHQIQRLCAAMSTVARGAGQDDLFTQFILTDSDFTREAITKRHLKSSDTFEILSLYRMLVGWLSCAPTDSPSTNALAHCLIAHAQWLARENSAIIQSLMRYAAPLQAAMFHGCSIFSRDITDRDMLEYLLAPSAHYGDLSLVYCWKTRNSNIQKILSESEVVEVLSTKLIDCVKQLDGNPKCVADRFGVAAAVLCCLEENAISKAVIAHPKLVQTVMRCAHSESFALMRAFFQCAFGIESCDAMAALISTASAEIGLLTGEKRAARLQLLLTSLPQQPASTYLCANNFALPQVLKDMANVGPYEHRLLACTLIARICDQKALFTQLFRKELPLAVKEELKLGQRNLLAFLAEHVDAEDAMTQNAATKALKECQAKILVRPDGIVPMYYALRRSAGDVKTALLLITRSVFLKVNQSVGVLSLALRIVEWLLIANQSALTAKDVDQCADFMLFAALHSDKTLAKEALQTLQKVMAQCSASTVQGIWNTNLTLLFAVSPQTLTVASPDVIMDTRKQMWAKSEADASSNDFPLDLSSSASQSAEAYLSSARVEAKLKLQETFTQSFLDSLHRGGKGYEILVSEALCGFEEVRHSSKKLEKQKISKKASEQLCSLPAELKRGISMTLMDCFALGSSESVSRTFQRAASHALVLSIESCDDQTSASILSSVDKLLCAEATRICSEVDSTNIVESTILLDKPLLEAYLKAENQNYLADKFAYAKRFVDEKTLSENEKAYCDTIAQLHNFTDAFYSEKLQQMAARHFELRERTFAPLLRILGNISILTQTNVSHGSIDTIVGTLIEILKTPQCQLPECVTLVERMISNIIARNCRSHNRFAPETMACFLVHACVGVMKPNHTETCDLAEKWVQSAMRGFPSGKPVPVLQVIFPHLVAAFFGQPCVPLRTMFSAIGVEDCVKVSEVRPNSSDSSAFRWLKKARPVKKHMFAHSAQSTVVSILSDGLFSRPGDVSNAVLDSLISIAQIEPVFSADIAAKIIENRQAMHGDSTLKRLVALLFDEDVELVRAALECLPSAKSIAQFAKPITIGVCICLLSKDERIVALAEKVSSAFSLHREELAIDRFVEILFRVDERTFERLAGIFATIVGADAKLGPKSTQVLLPKLVGTSDDALRCAQVLGQTDVFGADQFDDVLAAFLKAVAIDTPALQKAIIQSALQILRRCNDENQSTAQRSIETHQTAVVDGKSFSPEAALLTISSAALSTQNPSAGEFLRCFDAAHTIAKKKIPAHFKSTLCEEMHRFSAKLSVADASSCTDAVLALLSYLFDLNSPTKQILDSACIALLVACVSGMGVHSMHSLGIAVLVQEKVSAPKASIRTRAITLVDALHEAFGYLYEPYILSLNKELLEAFFDSDGEASKAAKVALRRIIARLSPVGTQQILPTLLAESDTDSHKAKRNLMQLIVSLTLENAAQVLTVLHVIIPVVVGYLSDTHDLVATGAVETITRIGSIIPCTEIRDHIRRIIAALQNPGSETEDALDALLSVRFHHSVDIASLSLVLPIILRGIHERSIHTKMKAAQILCSITSILTDFSTLMGESLAIVEKLFDTIGEPVAEYQSSIAKAITALLEHHEEATQRSHMEKYKTILTATATPPLERTGAARVVSSLFGILPSDALTSLFVTMEDIFSNATCEAKVGYLELFHELVQSEPWETDECISKIVSMLLESITDANADVQAKAMEVARVVIRSNCEAAREEMLQRLLENVELAEFGARKRSLLLLADLFFQLGGVHLQTKSEEEENSDDENDGEDAEGEAQAAQAQQTETLARQDKTIEEHFANLSAAVDEKTIQRVLAAVYVMRLERDKELKNISTTLWKTFVSNSHAYVKCIAPMISAYIGRLYSSSDEDDETLATQAAKVILVRFPEEPIAALFADLMEKASASEDRTHALCGLTQLLPRISDELFARLLGDLESIIQSGLKRTSERFRSRFMPFVERIISMNGQHVLERIVAKQAALVAEGEDAIEGFRTLFVIRPKAVANILVKSVEQNESGCTTADVQVLTALFGDETIQTHIEKFSMRILERLVIAVEAFGADPDAVITLFSELCALLKDNVKEIFALISGYPRSSDSLGGKKLRIALLCALGESLAASEETEMLNEIFAMLIGEFGSEDEDYVRLVQQHLTELIAEIQANAEDECPLRAHVACVSGCLRATRQGCILRDNGVFMPLSNVYGIQSVLPFYRDAFCGGSDHERSEALQGLAYIFNIVDQSTVSSVWPQIIGEVIFLVYSEVAVSTDIVEFFVQTLPLVDDEVAAIYGSPIVTLLFDTFLAHPDPKARAAAIQCVYVIAAKGLDDRVPLLAVQTASLTFQRLQRPHISIMESVCAGLVIFFKHGPCDIPLQCTETLFVFLDRHLEGPQMSMPAVCKAYGYLIMLRGEDGCVKEQMQRKSPLVNRSALLEGYAMCSAQCGASFDASITSYVTAEFFTDRAIAGMDAEKRKHAIRLVCRCLAAISDIETLQQVWACTMRMLDEDFEVAKHKWKIRKIYKTDSNLRRLSEELMAVSQRIAKSASERSDAHESFPKCVSYEYDSEVEDAWEY